MSLADNIKQLINKNKKITSNLIATDNPNDANSRMVPNLASLTEVNQKKLVAL